MFCLFFVEILSQNRIDRRIFFFQIYIIRSCFLPWFQSCSLYLFLRIILDDHTRTQGLSSITILLHSVLLFRLISLLVLPPCLACAVSILCNYRLLFLNPIQFWLICRSSALLLPEIRKFFLLFVLFPNVRTELIPFFLFQHSFVDGTAWVWLSDLSVDVLVLVVFGVRASLFVQFVLGSFRKLETCLCFSDWSVKFVVLSMYRIVKLNSRSQYIVSNACMHSILVIKTGVFF